MLNLDEPTKHYAKEMKPDTKGHMLYDYIYKIPLRENFDSLMPGVRKRGNMEKLLNDYRVLLCSDENILLLNYVNVLNATKVFTLDLLFLSYMNFTSGNF